MWQWWIPASEQTPGLVSVHIRLFFVGPDNGLFTYILDEETGVEVRRLQNRRYGLDSEALRLTTHLLHRCNLVTKGQPLGSLAGWSLMQNGLLSLNPDGTTM